MLVRGTLKSVPTLGASPAGFGFDERGGRRAEREAVLARSAVPRAGLRREEGFSSILYATLKSRFPPCIPLRCEFLSTAHI